MTQPTMTGEPRGSSSAPLKGRSMLEVAWCRKSLIGLATVFGLGLGVLFYTQATPQYQSKAQILIVKKRPDSFTGIDTRNLAIEDYVGTHKTLIESPTIINGAIQKRNLAKLECFTDKEDLTELIQKSLTVRRNLTGNAAGANSPNNNHVLDLAFRTTNPVEATAVLDAIIESYKDYLEETYRVIGDDMLKLITQARDVLQQDLKNQDTAYRKFRQEAPLLLSQKQQDGPSVTQQRLSGIESKRSALLVRRAEIQGYLKQSTPAWRLTAVRKSCW